MGPPAALERGLGRSTAHRDLGQSQELAGGHGVLAPAVPCCPLSPPLGRWAWEDGPPRTPARPRQALLLTSSRQFLVLSNHGLGLSPRLPVWVAGKVGTEVRLVCLGAEAARRPPSSCGPLSPAPLPPPPLPPLLSCGGFPSLQGQTTGRGPHDFAVGGAKG